MQILHVCMMLIILLSVYHVVDSFNETGYGLAEPLPVQLLYCFFSILLLLKIQVQPSLPCVFTALRSILSKD